VSGSFAPSRKSVIANLERVGLSEERIGHSIAVADLASRIAQNMIKEKIMVDHRVFEAGALFHDIGLAKQPPELWSAEHGVVGAWGAPNLLHFVSIDTKATHRKRLPS
jgi:putative nucleotidyltransferase with HDIG domain